MRSPEKGSSAFPALMAVTANPAIIIVQTMVAAGARLAGCERTASKVSSEVPAAPTPTPIMRKAISEMKRPIGKSFCISAVP